MVLRPEAEGYEQVCAVKRKRKENDLHDDILLFNRKGGGFVDKRWADEY